MALASEGLRAMEEARAMIAALMARIAEKEGTLSKIPEAWRGTSPKVHQMAQELNVEKKALAQLQDRAYKKYGVALGAGTAGGGAMLAGGDQAQAQDEGDQVAQQPLRFDPSQVAGPTNPASGRLIDQLRGQPYQARFPGGPPRDTGDGDGGDNAAITPELEQLRSAIIAKMLQRYGHKLPPEAIRQLVTGGSPVGGSPPAGGAPQAALQGAVPEATGQLPPWMMQGEGGGPSPAPAGTLGAVDLANIPPPISRIEQMRRRLPPPLPGMIPQEQVAGFDTTAPLAGAGGEGMPDLPDPRQALEAIQPGLTEELTQRFGGALGTMVKNSGKAAVAIGTDLGAGLGDLGRLLLPTLHPSPVEMPGGGQLQWAPEQGNPLRPMADAALQRLIQENPEQARTITDLVTIGSTLAPIGEIGSLAKGGLTKAKNVRAAGKGLMGAIRDIQKVEPFAVGPAAQAAAPEAAAAPAGSLWQRLRSAVAIPAGPQVDPLIAQAAKAQLAATELAKKAATPGLSSAEQAAASQAAVAASKWASKAAKDAGIPTVMQIQSKMGNTFDEARRIRNEILMGTVPPDLQSLGAAARPITAKVVSPAPLPGQVPALATRNALPTTNIDKAANTAGRIFAGIRQRYAAAPGSRFDVARLFKEGEAKKVLTEGLAGSREAFNNLAEQIRVGAAQKSRDLMEAMFKVTKGDPDELRKMGALLSRASSGKSPKAVDILLRDLDPEVRKAFDATLGWFDKQTATLERIGGMSGAEAKLFKQTLGRDKLTTFNALRDPQHINDVRGGDAWNKLYALIERTSAEHIRMPTKFHGRLTQVTKMKPEDIVAEMEHMMSSEVVRAYQTEGKLPNKLLNQSPGLRAVAGMKATDPLLRDLFGEVKDFPTQFELASRAMATRIAHQHVGSNLVKRMFEVGLASPTKKPGMTHLIEGEHALKGVKVWVPPEIADVLEFGQKAASDLSEFGLWMARARAAKTVGSPTSAGVMNFLSNLVNTVASGDALRSEFWVNDLPDAVKAGGQAIRRGTARTAQGFERSLAGQGLGSGAIGGEIETYMKQSGVLPDVLNESERYGKTSRRVRGFTRGMQRFFEQGDVIPKRAIAPRNVAEMSNAMRHATPQELANAEELFGSANPTEIVGERIRNQFQTYSRVPEGWRELSRKHPLVGAFISFPIEMARNAGQHFNYLGKELKMALRSTTPEVRAYWSKQAMRHAAGLTVAAGLPAVAKETWEAAHGYPFSEEQSKVLEERGVPEYDRGNVAVLDRKGDEVTYSPMGRGDYFNQLHKAANAGLDLAAAIYRGDTAHIDDRAIDLFMETAGQLLPYQLPTKTLYEGLSNKRLEGGVVESILAGQRGYETPLLSNATSPLGYLKDYATKSLGPTVLPTTAIQAARLAGGTSPREVFPVGQLKKTNLAISMRREANELADEKNRLYVARLSQLSRDQQMSVEEKRRKVNEMRDDWNNGLGQRIFDAAQAWDKLFPRNRVLNEMYKVGQKHLGTALNEGKVPMFDEVFAGSIPPEVRRR